MTLVALSFAALMLAEPSQQSPRGDTALLDLDRAMQAHLDSTSRQADKAWIGTMDRLGLVVDAIPASRLMGKVAETVIASKIPLYLLTGETLSRLSSREVERRMGENLGSVIRRTLPAKDISFSSMGAKKLENRFHILEKLQHAATEDGLVAAEVKVLSRLWEQAVQNDLKVTMEQVRKNTKSLRDAVKGQRLLDENLKAMNANLEKVASAVEVLARSMSEAEEKDAKWLNQAWEIGTFEERLSIARACESASTAACSNMDSREKEKILARGRVYDAANAVGHATDLYVKGAAQMADNLGIPLPKWTGKAITGVSAASSLAAGIASENPAQIVNGLIGLTSLFKKRQPSPEQIIVSRLDRIDEHLAKMTELLKNIDEKLNLILRRQEVIQDSLNRIEKALVVQHVIGNASLATLDQINRERARACGALQVAADAPGVWSFFFKNRLIYPSEKLTARTRRDNAHFDSECRVFLQAQFNSGVDNSDLIFLTLSAQSAAGKTHRVVKRESEARRLVDDLELLLGDSIGVLQPILMAEMSSRTELIGRVANRHLLTWNLDEGSEEVHSAVKDLQLNRILPILARLVLFIREDPQNRLLCEASSSLERYLARAVLQRLLFDTDSALAVFAVRFAEGGTDQDSFAKAFQEEMSRLGFGKNSELDKRLSTHFIGDLLDAYLWQAAESGAGYLRQRKTLELAWRSKADDVISAIINSIRGRQKAQTRPLREMLTVQRLQDSSVEICLTPDGGKHLAPLSGKNCLDFDSYLMRSGWDEPDEIQSARFWLRMFSAERLHVLTDSRSVVCSL